MKTVTAEQSYSPSLTELARQFIKTLTLHMQTGFQPLPKSEFGHTRSRFSFPRFRKNIKKQYFFILPIIIVLIVGVFLVGKFLNKDSQGVAGVSDQRIVVRKPLSTQEVNKAYTFDVFDITGEPTKIEYTLEQVELRDEIIVKGQPAVAVKGRLFVIVNLRLKNTSQTAVDMETRNYIRLKVNNSDELLAPDIHNDLVEVQAISSKGTRVGFPINDTDANLELQVGEIDGEKEAIELTIEP